MFIIFLLLFSVILLVFSTMASSNSLLLDNIDDLFGPPTSMVVSSLAIPANASTMRAENPFRESNTPEVSEDENPLSYAFSEQNQQLRLEINRGLTKIERYYGQSLRGKQRQVLRNLYKGQSVVLRAPTGWGKSRIFQGFRLMPQKDKDSMDPRKDPITIIVTPLLGLGDAQVLELNFDSLLSPSFTLLSLCTMDLDTPKVSVVLKSQNDWRAWYDIKTTAVTRHVWDYINPDLPVQPFEPQPPVEPGFHLVKTGVRNVTEFSAEEYEAWKRLIKDFDRRNTQYKEVFRNLNAVKTLIRALIARQHHHFVYAKQTACEELKALKNRFALTDKERRIELKKQYRELQKTPRSIDIDLWLSKWEQVYSECLEANIPAVKDDDPVEDFVNACESINPEFFLYASRALPQHVLFSS